MPVSIRLEVPYRQLDDIARELLSTRQHFGVAAWSLTSSAIEFLKKTTPRSREGTDHIADYWGRVALKSPEGFIETIIIRNTHPRSAEILPFLEFGTRPHLIPGRPILRFELDDGTVIFTRLVHHPGTKPYKMVQQARAALEQQIIVMEDEIRSRIVEELMRKT
jgi:hypothetical protein